MSDFSPPKGPPKGSLPGFNWLIHMVIVRFARNRYYISHACRIDTAPGTGRRRASRLWDARFP
jgi:hypothetical protein